MKILWILNFFLNFSEVILHKLIRKNSRHEITGGSMNVSEVLQTSWKLKICFEILTVLVLTASSGSFRKGRIYYEDVSRNVKRFYELLWSSVNYSEVLYISRMFSEFQTFWKMSDLFERSSLNLFYEKFLKLFSLHFLEFIDTYLNISEHLDFF